ncbi:MAG: phosphate signaling complex protein PhoU [Chloroflexi bacterium]|nr:phosphate signaling complex protein PhoU [Chloroflexota bacterium]
MRTLFERELSEIREGIQIMSAQAAGATARAVSALINHNFDEAREVKRDDKLMDALRYKVENDCLLAMATQQPVARDLRELVAATFVAVELERCGDYAKGIAKAARKTTRSDSGLGVFNLAEMDVLVRDMLSQAAHAFLSRDVEEAHRVIATDVVVDQHYNVLLNSTMHAMSENVRHIECGTWLLHAGHCLERLGDRATNIAERVIFVETGVITGDMNVHSPGAARDLR